MNTELLREDERCITVDHTLTEYLELLRQRLIEEREKNAVLECQLQSAKNELDDSEGTNKLAWAELPEARKAVSALARRLSSQAAMKEGK